MSRQQLGQHFLSDISWRTRIAETLPASHDSTWVEIGAGHGEMTELLATRARRVIAIETDAALASALRERAARSTAPIAPLRERAARLPANATASGVTAGHAIEIVHADILSLDLAALVLDRATKEPLHRISSQPPDAVSTLGGRGLPAQAGFSPDINRPLPSGVSTPEGSRSRQGTSFYTDAGSATVPKNAPMRGALAPEAGLEAREAAHQPNPATRFRVYGNLPYYITSPILSHLFRFADYIDSIHIVTQLEVALRIAAHPRSRDYGYLSTLCQFYARPELVFRIPPGAFQPPPKITSALIEMRFPGERASLGIRDEHAFLKFLQTCFAHKRKTLRNNLRGTYEHDAVAKALATGALTENSRAEELTLHQFAQIFTALAG